MADRPPGGEPRAWQRRAFLGGLGVGVTGIAAGLVYNIAPGFWRQYAREFGRPVDPAPHTPHPAQWPDRGVHAAWLGHSTVLIRIDGYSILTDPVFSARVGIGLGPIILGLKRLVAPALEPAMLPPIDLVLLSHAHFDHFDLPSLAVLESPRTDVITARGTADLLRPGQWKSVREIGWGDSAESGPVSVRGLQVNHWGARMRTDTWRGYNGYLLASGKRRVLFAGDTARTDLFRQVGGAELAIFPIGAYNPWIHAHCSPEEAWNMAQDARAELVLPIHHQTFRLSSEPYFEPIERIVSAAGPAPDRVVIRRIGEELRLG